MVRVKFLVFALMALGLGLAHLFVLSGPMGAQAKDEAQSQAAAGTAEFVRTLEARRGIARALALKLAASAELASAAQDMSSPDAPTAERFAPVRSVAEAALPQNLPGVVLGVVTPGGAMYARTGEEPSSDMAALDVKALAQTDAPSVMEAFGAPHAFAAVPLVRRFARIPGAEKLETQLAATLVVGVPLLPEGALEEAAKASGAAALGLVKENALVASGGSEKGHLEKALGSLKEGQQAAAVHSGHLQMLGPVKLPLLTHQDFMGGKAPLIVGTRRALEGTPYQVIALAQTKLMGRLADYQRIAIFGLGALLGVSLVWTVLMGSGKRSGQEGSETGGDTLGLSQAMAKMAAQQAAAPAPQSAEPPPVTHPGLELTAATPVDQLSQPATGEFLMGAPLAEGQDAPAGMASLPASAPFPFPPEPQAQPYDAQAFSAQRQSAASLPFDAEPQSSPGEPQAGATAAPRAGAFHFEEIPTAAYSLQQAADPYAAAAALGSNPVEEAPETTRVAAIPKELLQASARPPTQELPLPPAFASPPPSAPSVAPVPWGEPVPQAPAAQPVSPYQQFLGNSGDVFSEEEFHFQEVFREFVLTRERCNEASDGLTYDKFVQKLRKNKEQLVQKYACRTVKFQVYVKEGKAALKATPVKD
ncbi:MAG TPA: MXAN_5187 family protein [Hyalangium sp.]|nr:MXAN_5187 family protein [Hyalangium sp.]